MRALYLVRHGETAWNAERRLQGRADIDLSDRGVAQVRALRPGLAGLLAQQEGEVTVVTSPLARAVRTASLLGLSPDLVDARWQETDLGSWTGRTREELVGEGDGYAAWRRGTLDPPGAETRTDVAGRVRAALAALADHDVVVATTHGGTIRAVLAELVGLGTGSVVPVLPGSLTVVDTSRTQPRLQAFNVTPFAAASEPVALAGAGEPTD